MNVLDATDFSVLVGWVEWSGYMTTIPLINWSDSDGMDSIIYVDATEVPPPSSGTLILIYQPSTVLRFRGTVTATQTSNGIHTIYATDAIAKLKALGADYFRQEYNSRISKSAAVTIVDNRVRITESGLILDGSAFMSIYGGQDTVVSTASRQNTYSFMGDTSSSSTPNYTITCIFSDFAYAAIFGLDIKMELDAHNSDSPSGYSNSTWRMKVSSTSDGWENTIYFTMESGYGGKYYQSIKHMDLSSYAVTGPLTIVLTCTAFDHYWSLSGDRYHRCGPWVGADSRLSISDSDGDYASDYGMQMWIDGGEYRRISSFSQEGSYYFIDEIENVGDPVEEVRTGTICKYAVISGTVAISTILSHAGKFVGIPISALSAVQNVLSFYVLRGKFIYDVCKSLLDIPQTAGSWAGYRCAIRGSIGTTDAVVIRRIREVSESSSLTFYPGDNFVLSSDIIKKSGGKTSQIMLKSSTETSNNTKTRSLITCVRGPSQAIKIQSNKSQSDLKTIADLQSVGVGSIKDAQSGDISGTLKLDGLVWDTVDMNESSDTYGDGAIITYGDPDNNIISAKAKILKVSWDMDKMTTQLTLGHLDSPSVTKLSLVDMDRTDSSSTKDSLGRYVGYCAVNATIVSNPTSLRIGTATAWSPYVSGLLINTPWGRTLHVEIPSTVFHSEGSHAITRISTLYQNISLSSTYYQDLTEDMDMLVVEIWELL